VAVVDLIAAGRKLYQPFN